MGLGGIQNDLLLKLLNASSARAKVIAGNLANQNVAGYQRKILRFEDLLAQELDGGDGDPLAVEPKIEVDRTTPSSPDGNNVSLELERAEMTENRLLFDLYASILQTRMDLLRVAIQESR